MQRVSVSLPESLSTLYLTLIGKYFIQVARFDPSKGIPDVIKSYAEFHRLLREKPSYSNSIDVPQLLM
jgi:hypothetical protein